MRIVVAHHQRQRKLPASLFGEGKTDQAAAVLGHEIDVFGAHPLGRDEQKVALVLAILVVDHDDHAALAKIRDDLLDRAYAAGLGPLRCAHRLARRGHRRLPTQPLRSSSSRETACPDALGPSLASTRRSR